MAKKKPTTNGMPSQTAQESDRYFLSLSLENARCFRDKQTLDLSDGKGRPAQWTLLLGENGTGKTTLLQAMALLELVVPGGARRGYPRVVSMVHFFPQRRLGLARRPGVPAVLSAEIALTSLRSAKATVEKGTVHLELDEADQHVGETRQSEPHKWAAPICYGYGAARRSGESAIGEQDLGDPTASLFSDRADLLNAQEWLLQLDYTASKRSDVQKRQKERRDQVTALLIAILPEVDDLRFVAPEGVRPMSRVEFKTPYGWAPLRQLGYGYQGLIAWIVDFAAPMVERYPDSADPLAEPAVVLVDEIDLHLHPKWQRSLISYLTERFPNTQFIATAHSPLIVQAATGANLAVLRREGDHVIIDNDVDAIRGWRVDQILTSDLFGLKSARPPELEGLLERRKALLTKPRLTEADRRELAELEEAIGDLPTGESAEDVEIRSLLRESLELLRQKKA